MSRPKKGTKAGEIATSKWRETMLKKYGGETGLHKKMSEAGAEGGRNGHTGGFASDRERARVAGAKGGSMSRRDEAKSWFDKNENKIVQLLGDGASYGEIAERLGVSLSRVYYAMEKYGAHL